MENATTLVDFINRYGDNLQDRVKLTTCLRLLGPRWEHTWIVSMALYYFRYISEQLNEDFSEKVNDCLRKYLKFRELVYLYHLDKLWTVKPILKGDRVIQLLKLSRPTIIVNRLLCELVVWQISRFPPYVSCLPLLDETLKAKQVRSFLENLSVSEAENYILRLYATQQDKLTADIYPPRDI